MFNIAAKSKYLDLSRSFKLFYLLAGGAFMCVLGYLVYSDFIVVTTMVVCTIILYIFFSRPPKDIQVSINNKSIKINDDETEWTNIVGWAVVHLDSVLEFTIQTSKMNRPFIYFYISENNPKTKELILNLSQFLPYNEDIPQRNTLHNILRNAGWK